MFAKIRHIAIITENYERMANFYKSLFNMKKITSGMTDEKGEYNPNRGHVSDGLIGYALLQRHAGTRSGIDHFGFVVEDIQTVKERMSKKYSSLRSVRSLEHVPFAVMRALDPVGVHMDVSQKGMSKVREGYTENGWDQSRQLNHIAIRASEPAVVAEFYQEVFELRAVEGLSEEGGYCVSDGTVSIAICPCHDSSYRVVTEGLDHIGFKVESLDKAKMDLEELSKSSPESAPKKIDLGRFGPTTLKELQSCGVGKYQMADPDGNLLDLSE